ncbi:MAG TPA: lysylphosphatidylglycerol synthase domain-containing protein [Solirubrobacteraceae bacterium]|nr:lysylphosphatidylglycerol synthase domain-containing protein [Solirubrobacteraceae bacterium]
MRIALVSPYSWTYPGGVTRHIEALAAELDGLGQDVRILAPYDPDDALSRRLHRGARPQSREPPERFVSLGRTFGLPANGAVSNITGTPHAVLALRRELRDGGYDVAHLHEPVVPVVCWDALLSAGRLPLVGTFHTYSENAITNGIAAVALGARRRMNRLRVRIAVSEAAAWTARRFHGGRYRIVPNGVHVAEGRRKDDVSGKERPADVAPLRILFVGQAVERKGLPVLLRAFEALRDHVPATLTLVGASAEEVAHMTLDDRCVRALGKVTEQRKLEELARADVLCAPSLHGESFGMVITEGLAAGTPVLASDIPGYRDVMRDGVDGGLVPAGDPLALAEALRRLALEPARRARMAAAARERAERFAWPHVAAEVLDCYEQARAIGEPSTRLARTAARHGLMPADLLPRVPAQRLPSLQAPPRSVAETAPLGARARSLRTVRRLGLVASTVAGAGLAALALQRVGVTRVAASLVASKPGLLAAGLALMCAAMFVRALAWHAILVAAPTWRRAKRRDAMQGTFIGVLMSCTLPARLGEPSRALIVARRLGRARETLPVVLGTMVSQTLLNLLALAVLGGVTLSSVSVFEGHDRALLLIALAPLAALVAVLLAPILIPPSAVSRSRRLQALLAGVRGALLRLRDGLRVFRRPRRAVLVTATQLGAWALQWMSCWLLLMALGLDSHAGVGAAAAVLFAVNVTAVVPATPANVGVFQAACVAVLVGAYHVSTADAIAYGIVLQAVEVATALLMGVPALLNEGLSWRDVRLRTLHAAPVELRPLPEPVGGLSRAES